MTYAELHCHTNFSFLDGASAADELVERAVGLGLSGLAVTDHNGLYGAVRFISAARAAGIHPVVGVEIELLDPAVADPEEVVVPGRRRWRSGRSMSGSVRRAPRAVQDGEPARPRAERERLPGHRQPVREDLRGIGSAARGPHLVLLARDDTGYRSLCRLVSRANLAGTKGVPRFDQALLAANTEGLIALSGCREGEIARRLLVGDRKGAAAVARAYGAMFASGAGSAGDGFVLELTHHLQPDDDWLVAETIDLAERLGLPLVVTNDVHYALPEGREMHDVLTCIRHGRTLDTLADLRSPSGEAYVKTKAELLALPPGDGSLGATVARAWAEGVRSAEELAAACSVDLGFEQYRFPGFAVPAGETPFSHLSQLCWEGAQRRYHPLTSAVVKQLAHELSVIERTGLAEFFLICWDLMRFARDHRIPAQGRGSAADSIVAYVLGITRVDPIRHNLLFERFINEGRTTYPDVDIDFSSERREEVIQYVYGKYGPEHTGMVCNVVTYRARSAVREIGYALGFPRPLVDRVAKALETYDSVMVRRDLEADGGFAEFFRRPGEGEAPEAVAAVAAAEVRGLTDGMGELNHARGGRLRFAGGVAGASAVGVAPGVAGASAVGVAPGVAPASQEPLRGAETAAAAGSSEPEIGSVNRLRLIPDGSRWVEGHEAPQEASHKASRDIRVVHEDESLPDALAPRTALRGGGRSDDEGGPGDSPASVRWLHEGRGTGYARDDAARLVPPALVEGRRIDPESGMLEAAPRRTDRLGRPERWDPPAPASATMGRGGDRGPTDRLGRPDPHSSVARVESSGRWLTGASPRPSEGSPAGGSTIGLSPWERWLEFCARIDGFPRHLSIHSGGMLITAAPLIDIAPLERATMPDRVVVQYDKRDVEEIKLIKLDLLGLGMLAAMDEALQLIEHDCAVCIDLDRLPEGIPEVFEMLQAADTVGLFQVESRAQMQTLPKSRPTCLDDLVVEVAIIRPGPIQGNAVHPYLRRKQGLEPVTYLHPSLEPILHDSLGVILYQEQVMRIAIEVAGFTPAGSDGFRRAMGTWRSEREMEKLHVQFVEGCVQVQGLPVDDSEELFRQCAAFASFGFAKSHAAAFARTAYESAFLKLFYPAQLLAGLINAQPMGFYPVEVLANDAKRHGVAVLPADINASAYKTTTEWVGRPGWARAGERGDDGSADDEPGETLPRGVGIDRRPPPVRSSSCFVPGSAARERWAAESATGWGVRLGLSLVKGIGEEHETRLDAELARGPYTSLADVVARTGLGEEVIERLIRAGGLDSLGVARRTLLWQLREVAGATKGKVDGRSLRAAARGSGKAAGRPMDLRLPATEAPELPPISESERIGDAYAVVGLDGRRQVVELFRPALVRLGAVPNASLADRGPGRIRLGGLVVTRQHPMTARGTVFLALEDETGIVNVTLWPDAWARLRGIVRRHALLLVDGDLQREGTVVNVIAREVRSLVEASSEVGGPISPVGIRQLGYSGMRRLG
jgi:DNA polymerase III alpha subunit